MVTCGTYRKEHHFQSSKRLDVLQRGLFKLAGEGGWSLEAWAIFSNHYHFVAHSPEDEESSDSLRRMLMELHSRTARWVNKLDRTPGRKVWHNYFESQLTYQKSYLARLAYVHENPVHHGLVLRAVDYPWCSARWIEKEAEASILKTFGSFDTKKVKVVDSYEPVLPE